jgi:hypothetical protein
VHDIVRIFDGGCDKEKKRKFFQKLMENKSWVGGQLLKSANTQKIPNFLNHLTFNFLIADPQSSKEQED